MSLTLNTFPMQTDLRTCFTYHQGYCSLFSRRRTDRTVLAETGRRALRANHFARVQSERRAFWPFTPPALSRAHPTRLTPFPMATSLSTHQLFTPAGLTGRRVSRGASRRRATSVRVRPLARKISVPSFAPGLCIEKDAAPRSRPDRVSLTSLVPFQRRRCGPATATRRMATASRCTCRRTPSRTRWDTTSPPSAKPRRRWETSSPWPRRG